MLALTTTFSVMKTIYDKLKRVESNGFPDVRVNKFDSNRRADKDRLVREFNKGRSFAFAEWKSLTKYSNDDFEQSFVSYDGALLACKRTHVSQDPPVLIRDEETGMITGVNSKEWSFVFATGLNKNEYYLEGVPYGVPMFTDKMLSELGKDQYPEKYIKIKDPMDDLSDVDESGDTYLDIMFAAIRSLQAEVAKLRNSFKYGITSYTGKTTAMSEIIDTPETEDEPLWTIDESDLSEITAYSVDFEGSDLPFFPKENVDFTVPGVAVINGTASWSDSLLELKKVEDPKIFLYLTSSDLNINIGLQELASTNALNLNLKNYFDINSVSKYNIVFVVSRSQTQIIDQNETKLAGPNFIWISVSNAEDGRILGEGYYNSNLNELQSSLFDISKRYTISTVDFTDLNLFKFNLYSKYQDFGNEVQPSTPSDTDYRYKVAHITIRSVTDYDELKSIYTKLPDNELIWEVKSKKLWIKTQGTLVAIGSNSGGDPSIPETGMTEIEVIEKLKSMGILYTDESGLQLSSVGDITFINNDTNSAFKVAVDANGELISTAVPNKTLAEKIKDLQNSTNKVSTVNDIRGFVARVHAAENEINPFATSDIGVNADRIKIGSVYCPLTTDVKFGCSHGFIELENTSDRDFPLDGCYLHYLHPATTGNLEVIALPLNGILKSGSTYLIRCKQYADASTNADVFISVDSYDQEWYIDGKLLDLSNDGKSAYGFALTYGNKDATDVADATKPSSAAIIGPNTVFRTVNDGTNSGKAPNKWKWYFIDSLLLNAFANETNKEWGTNKYNVSSNSIVKNMFELDPAKQAFQALTTYDSSRVRLASANDIQVLNLNKSKIEFPHSDLTFDIKNYTPKSSKLKKNVSTDKTKMNLEKPNMVTCSFGTNIYTTRCFNWISSGTFDEYVFIKNELGGWTAFESYKPITEAVQSASSYPRRKEFSVKATNAIYARLHGVFPGANIAYTSHKCIIDLAANALTSKKTYTYVVGRKDKNGNPDLDHCSKEQTFTLYPDTYTPRFYQITDQQGFHWIEYQVWSAAAKKLNTQIAADCSAKNIIPVLINTGDMTQNGTRINEWLDYYNGGECLFSHLEQMNVVGNNDLCGTDPAVLGTGDDVGKSNSYYFHVFYCYEVDESNLPIITTDSGIDRYVPSLYYFDFLTHRIVMLNSELTHITCRDWFDKHYDNEVVNVYTGWTFPSTPGKTPKYRGDFTSVYTMVYNILNSKGTKNVIAVCHEMPFTVVTTDSLLSSAKDKYRSLNGTSLIGCHMNQIHSSDTIGIYWLSRLLEHFKVKLCIGGHKHTYAATLPVRERYLYIVNGVTKDSSINGPMVMEPTLSNDATTVWIDNGDNLTKLPIADRAKYNLYEKHGDDKYIHPVTPVDNLTGGVVYFMCQATGYKLTSNKELPSNYQEFAQLIPETVTEADGSIKADAAQQKPMYVVIDVENGEFKIALLRFINILAGTKFSQLQYSTDDIVIECAKSATNSRYCTWETGFDYITTV